MQIKHSVSAFWSKKWWRVQGANERKNIMNQTCKTLTLMSNTISISVMLIKVILNL